jgi:hypothetical protein
MDKRAIGGAVVVLVLTNKKKSSMENKELYQTLEELRTGQITTNIAMEQILLLFDVVGRSELLVCPNCNSNDIHKNFYTDDYGCNGCGHLWAN